MADPDVPVPEKNFEAQGQNRSRSPEEMRSVRALSSFSGPMPPPNLLRQYEDVCPGLADRMFKFVESRSEHQKEIEKQIVNIEADRSRRQFAEARWGQCCALIITLASLAAGVYAAVNGHELAGSVIGVGGISGIVATFIYGRTSDKQNAKPPTPEPRPQNASNKKKSGRS